MKGRHLLAALSCLCCVGFSTLMSNEASADPGLSEQRDSNQQQYEACFNSDFGSKDESEKCTEWFADSACRGVFVDNMGDVTDYLAQENIVKYLTEAEAQVSKKKNCNVMGIKQLKYSLIKRDKNAKTEVQINRWKQILDGFQKLLPEQRRYFCELLGEGPYFEMLMADTTVKPVLKQCLSSLGPSSERQTSLIMQFENLAPEWITDEARANLLVDDIEHQRYNMAKARLLEIDVNKLSPTAREKLVARVAPLSRQVFQHEGMKETLPWIRGMEPPATTQEDRLLALYRFLIENSDVEDEWLIELEASILLPRGQYALVAKHVADGLNAKRKLNMKNINTLLSDLINYGVDTHNIPFLKQLALELSHTDPNVRSKNLSAVPSLQKMISTLLNHYYSVHTDSPKQQTSKKGNATPVSREYVELFQALLQIAHEEEIPGLQLALGLAYDEVGQSKDAIKIWLEAAKSGNASIAPRAWFYAIRTMENLKMTKEADEQKKMFVSRYPSSGWAKYFD